MVDFTGNKRWVSLGAVLGGSGISIIFVLLLPFFNSDAGSLLIRPPSPGSFVANASYMCTAFPTGELAASACIRKGDSIAPAQRYAFYQTLLPINESKSSGVDCVLPVYFLRPNATTFPLFNDTTIQFSNYSMVQRFFASFAAQPRLRRPLAVNDTLLAPGPRPIVNPLGNTTAGELLAELLAYRVNSLLAGYVDRASWQLRNATTATEACRRFTGSLVTTPWAATTAAFQYLASRGSLTDAQRVADYEATLAAAREINTAAPLCLTPAAPTLYETACFRFPRP